MLWLGIAATIGANVAYGAGYGLLGALISAWPAVAFIGSVEIAMQQVRRARVPHAATSGPVVPAVPGDVEQAVREAADMVYALLSPVVHRTSPSNAAGPPTATSARSPAPSAHSCAQATTASQPGQVRQARQPQVRSGQTRPLRQRRTGRPERSFDIPSATRLPITTRVQIGYLRYAQARANYRASEADDCRRPGACVRRWPTVFGGA